MKKNRPTRVPNKPRGYIFGATYNGFPAEARVVQALIGNCPSNWWCAAIIGHLRPAIEVTYKDETFYLDNADGTALTCLLNGTAPRPGFRLIPIAGFPLDDPSSELFYKATP